MSNLISKGGDEQSNNSEPAGENKNSSQHNVQHFDGKKVLYNVTSLELRHKIIGDVSVFSGDKTEMSFDWKLYTLKRVFTRRDLQGLRAKTYSLILVVTFGQEEAYK